MSTGQIDSGQSKRRLENQSIRNWENDQTGGRIKKLLNIMAMKLFCTYGDGLANVNISNLIKFIKHMVLAC